MYRVRERNRFFFFKSNLILKELQDLQNPISDLGGPIQSYPGP